MEQEGRALAPGKGRGESYYSDKGHREGQLRAAWINLADFWLQRTEAECKLFP